MKYIFILLYCTVILMVQSNEMYVICLLFSKAYNCQNQINHTSTPLN